MIDPFPKIFSFIISICLFLPLVPAAQIIPEFNGARAAGIGTASATISDVWAIQNNIGALAGLEAPTAAFGYNTRLNLQELTTFGALVGIPLLEGVVAASFTGFGTGAYQIHTAGLGYSHKINFVSLGAKLNYLQQSIENYESLGTLVLEAGGKAELLPTLHFAAHAFNLTQSSFSAKDDPRRLPVLLKAGLAYLPAENIQLFIQTLKNIAYPARFSAGLDYQVVKALSLRTGIMTAPVVASFGLGFCPGKFSFDYALRHHSTIGVAHHISIAYSFNQWKKP